MQDLTNRLALLCSGGMVFAARGRTVAMVSLVRSWGAQGGMVCVARDVWHTTCSCASGTLHGAWRGTLLVPGKSYANPNSPFWRSNGGLDPSGCGQKTNNPPTMPLDAPGCPRTPWRSPAA